MYNNKLRNKWKKYEKKWKFRDFYFNKCLRRHGIVKYFHRDHFMPRFDHKPMSICMKRFNLANHF